MKKFARMRTLDELLAFCRRKKWKVDTGAYEDGSDYISIKFREGRVKGTAFVSSCNGMFFGTIDRGLPFTSDDNLEGRPWFDALLDAALTNDPLPTMSFTQPAKKSSNPEAP